MAESVADRVGELARAVVRNLPRQRLGLGADDYLKVTVVPLRGATPRTVVFLDLALPCQPEDEFACQYPDGRWVQHRTANFSLSDESVLAATPERLVGAIVKGAEWAVAQLHTVPNR